MKKLSKNKLINWHTYQNVDIPIIGNVLVSGENGSGKSTLLDAIQYVLTAGNVKFNQAADSSSKRTLESYMRGKLSYENKKYLRDGYVISYIALEFFDPDTNRFDILGVVLDLPETSNTPDKVFFAVKDQLTDKLFLENNRPKLPANFFQQDKVQKMLSQKYMKSAIQSILGLAQNGKYFELVPKALAFKPIPDLENFVSSFLLKEDRVELDDLRENVYQFRRLEEIIKEQEEKVLDLEQLEKAHDEYCDIKNKEILFNLGKQYYQVLDSNKKIKSEDKKLKKLKDEHQEVENNIKILTDNQKTLTDIVQEYRMNLEQNDNYRLKNKLDQHIEVISSSLKAKRSDVAKYLDKINEMCDELKEFSWIKKLSSFPSCDVLTLKKVVKGITDAREEELKNQNKLYLEFSNRKNIINDNIKEYSAKLANLDKGKFLYPTSITILQQEIQNTLTNRYQKEIIIKPLCEYLKVEDEEWRCAIEGYLNTQKFDLIIEPLYFDEALIIYETIKKEKNIEGVGLVNVSKINDQEVVENSLFNHISSSNPYALSYAKYLLGRVVCCGQVEELKQHKIAVTKTCMTYRNHTARQMRKSSYEEPFIGHEAIRLQKEKYELALNETKELYKEVDNAYRNSVRRKRLLDSVNFMVFGLYITSLEEVLNLEKEEEKLKQELKEIKIDTLSLGMEKKLADKLLELKKLNDNLTSVSHKKIELEINIKNIDDSIKEIKEQTFVIQNEINKLLNDHIQLNDEFKKLSLRIDKSELSYNELLNQENKLSSSLNAVVARILTLEAEFSKKYTFDEEVSIEVVNKYLEELYRIREWDITKYKSQSIEAREKCQTSFHEDFICQIKNRILTAKDNLAELNKALKMKRFGKERYEFVFKKSLDQEMGMYYDIIMSDEISYENTLFENSLTDEYRMELNKLFDKLMADTSIVETDKILNFYTDYRNYMSYDIRISNGDGGTYSFKEVLKEKSGGETQTPFYVLIAASFEQLLKSKRRNTSVGCFVMFDEAFNNMDESRIEAMMKFYNQLSIQLMISVPPERIATIAPYVDTNLALITHKNNTVVKAMTFNGVL